MLRACLQARESQNVLERIYAPMFGYGIGSLGIVSIISVFIGAVSAVQTLTSS
jgi:hypothetical protein